MVQLLAQRQGVSPFNLAIYPVPRGHHVVP